MRLTDFAALSFDCYGTLIDWETGILATLRPWAARHGLAVTDDALLAEFSRVEPELQAARPATLYPDILADAFRSLGRHFDRAVSDAEARAFGQSVKDWPAFPDSAGRPRLPQAALQAGHPLEHRPRLLRPQQPQARRRIRSRRHRRGCRLLQADAAQLRSPAGTHGGARRAEGAPAAHGREPLSRSCAGEALRPRHRLDLPPGGQGQLRRHPRPGGASQAGLAGDDPGRSSPTSTARNKKTADERRSEGMNADSA